MSLRKAPIKTLPITEELLQLLQAIDQAHTSWRSTVNHLDAACDEVWLARMWEVENLESQYRACQDQLFLYLKQAIRL
ncbi:hypothetical protein C5612_19950 [Pseudomonas frederiksbergensis]|uniref:Uncharacterized protein n=1 Tax=Pseudomonas frederiksbergensis TaxID=104087 RepID=A0A2S8HGK7_9PSED|nr:hypothetical protein C5612_19950 [Pseudomonas frederiksbergensis]